MNLLVQQKNCIICNVTVPDHEWIQHLKSSTHKNKAQLFLQKLKDKLPKKTNKRTFQKTELENDKYTIEETDQALEGCSKIRENRICLGNKNKNCNPNEDNFSIFAQPYLSRIACFL
jgi:hypothetical protein